MTLRDLLRPDLLRPDVLWPDLLDLVLPLECGACRRPGSRWCARCDARLQQVGFASGPRRVRPDPVPTGLPVVHAWGAYAGPLRPAITAWKDEGRGDLTRLLAPCLSEAVSAAISAAGWVDGPVLVVPAPSSAASHRKRGEAPLARLVDAVLRSREPSRGAALRSAYGAIRAGRRVADQAGLGTAGRAANLHGALAVRERWRSVVAGRRCLVVDDVMTTGATLVECARALHEGGAPAVVAATIAATARRQTGSFAGAL